MSICTELATSVFFERWYANPAIYAFAECQRHCSGGSVEVDVRCTAGVVRLEFSATPVAATIFFMVSASTVWFTRMPSPVGLLLLAASEKGLRCLQFDAEKLPQAVRGEVWIESATALQPYVEQLRAYFRGELREFSCPLDLQGTAFQKECWEALLAIPYGSTCSYAELARRVGRPKAFRAVGQANHRNPIAIIVPCHRVVGAAGSLTGYGGGLEIKEKLLRLEGAMTQPALSFAETASRK